MITGWSCGPDLRFYDDAKHQPSEHALKATDKELHTESTVQSIFHLYRDT